MSEWRTVGLIPCWRSRWSHRACGSGTVCRVAKSGVGWGWWWCSTPAGVAAADTGVGAADTEAGTAAAAARAVGCRRAGEQDGTAAGQRAAGSSAGSVRKRDRCSGDRRNHHLRSHCCGNWPAAGEREPGTAAAGTAAVADIPLWARAVVEQVVPGASDLQKLGNYFGIKTKLIQVRVFVL